jgi:hypothetical protein
MHGDSSEAGDTRKTGRGVVGFLATAATYVVVVTVGWLGWSAASRFFPDRVSSASDAWFVVLFLLASIAGVAAHELGHLVAFQLVEFRLVLFAVNADRAETLSARARAVERTRATRDKSDT